MDTIYRSSYSRPAYRGIRIVWYILQVVEVLLGLRFVLKLLVANPAAGFTDFVYRITDPLVAPFMSVFQISRVEATVFEWTTLLAMLVYWLIAWGIIELFSVGDAEPVEGETVIKEKRIERRER